MKNIWNMHVLLGSGDHRLCKAHRVCCPSGTPRLRPRTSSRWQLAHCNENWGGRACKWHQRKNLKFIFPHECVSTWLAAFLERLWWGRTLHAWPGPAEHDRPDDSKVGSRFCHKHTRVCLLWQLGFTWCLTPVLLLKSPPSLPPRQFCAQPVHAHGVFCRHLSEGRTEASWRVIEGNRRRMMVDARLENKGENAYSTRLNITYTPNLRFSSLIVKVGCLPCF